MLDPIKGLILHLGQCIRKSNIRPSACHYQTPSMQFLWPALLRCFWTEDRMKSRLRPDSSPNPLPPRFLPDSPFRPRHRLLLPPKPAWSCYRKPPGPAVNEFLLKFPLNLIFQLLPNLNLLVRRCNPAAARAVTAHARLIVVGGRRYRKHDDRGLSFRFGFVLPGGVFWASCYCTRSMNRWKRRAVMAAAYTPKRRV